MSRSAEGGTSFIFWVSLIRPEARLLINQIPEGSAIRVRDLKLRVHLDDYIRRCTDKRNVIHAVIGVTGTEEYVPSEFPLGCSRSERSSTHFVSTFERWC